MLVDAVQALDGKLYILGGGWNVRGPQPTPFGIAVLIDVPWEEANRKHRFALHLVDEDGRPYVAEGADTPLQIGGEFEVGRPPGLREGSSIRVPLAINSGPLALPAGRRFRWELSINGNTTEGWQAVFDVRPA